MPVIARSLDDILQDAMVAALATFSAQQVAIDASVGFNAVRDKLTPPTDRELPLVNVWLESLTPAQAGSSARTAMQETARFNVDCYAAGADWDGDGLDESRAMARLAYLKEQVRFALFRLINVDFGLSAGIFGRKRWPTWQLFQTDLKLPEREVVAGRWSVELEYTWTPEDITGVVPEKINVDAGLWSGLYDY